MRLPRVLVIGGVATLTITLAACSSAATPPGSSPASTSRPASPTSSAPLSSTPPTGAASATTAAAPQVTNRTGAATVPAYATICDLLPLALARTVLPTLPDQPYDHGDGNCAFSSSPDEAVSGADKVTWVHPMPDTPDLVTTARTRQAADTSDCAANLACTAATGADVTVGDSGFCSIRTSTAMTTSVVLSWERGSTGLELDVFGAGPDVSCARAVVVAAGINAQL